MDLALSSPQLMESDPVLPNGEARGRDRRHAGRLPGRRRLDTGTGADRSEGGTERIGRGQDRPTPGSEAVEQALERAWICSRICFRRFTANPARLPRLLARLVLGQQQEDAQMFPGISRRRAR